jgi:hypothetical protein
MPATKPQKLDVDTDHFSILNITPPYVDICLQFASISEHEFSKIARIAAAYPNDARLIEMVRSAGDASGKVPYLMAAGETPASILDTLREVAQPQAERLQALPGPLQATISLLLSLNAVPSGCEAYALAALLEIDRMQEEMIHMLRGLMVGRKLAREFHHDNLAALETLDKDWPRLRGERSSQWHTQPLPEWPHMQYHPVFDHNHHLVGVRETCVIVESPGARTLKRLTPAVLQCPMPEAEPAPATRSVDWIIRDTGKVGRHFTRALLGIIKTHLEAEQVALDAGDHDLINRHAREALQEFLNRTP